MRMKRIVPFIIGLFLIPLLSISCQAIEEKRYSLQIKITISSLFPFQTLSPIVVSFELRNMGNEIFSGTLTVKGKTDKRSLIGAKYDISNLTKNAVYKDSVSFGTYDEGTYVFTLEIEAHDAPSEIELYQDSKLVSEGVRVEATSSFFVYSFTNFLTIMGIVATIVIAIVTIYYKVIRPSQVFRDLKFQARGDLRSSINHFCDIWEDRECMIPYTDLRADLVVLIRNIRQLARNEFAKLSKEEITKIRDVSRVFLRVAGKFRKEDDNIWSKKVESEMEEVCKKLRDIAKELA